MALLSQQDFLKCNLAWLLCMQQFFRPQISINLCRFLSEFISNIYIRLKLLVDIVSLILYDRDLLINILKCQYILAVFYWPCHVIKKRLSTYESARLT